MASPVRKPSLACPAACPASALASRALGTRKGGSIFGDMESSDPMLSDRSMATRSAPRKTDGGEHEAPAKQHEAPAKQHSASRKMDTGRHAAPEKMVQDTRKHEAAKPVPPTDTIYPAAKVTKGSKFSALYDKFSFHKSKICQKGVKASTPSGGASPISPDIKEEHMGFEPDPEDHCSGSVLRQRRKQPKSLKLSARGSDNSPHADSLPKKLVQSAPISRSSDKHRNSFLRHELDMFAETSKSKAKSQGSMSQATLESVSSGEAAARDVSFNDAGDVNLVEDDAALEALDLHRRLIQNIRGEGPAALAAFRKAIKDGKQPLRSVKLCFVGHARAGKTSTLLALAGREFDPVQPSTHGVDTCSFAHELLEAGHGSDAPWNRLEQRKGLAGILEQGVAATAAKQLLIEAGAQKQAAPEAEEGGPADAFGHTALHALHASVASCRSAEGCLEETSALREECASVAPQVIKMPVDLIVQGVEKAKMGELEDSHSERSPVVMQTWDFAGQDMYYSMAHVFLTSLGIYVLVVDLSKWAGPWVEAGSTGPSSELTDSVGFWLGAILVHAPDARLVIVGTHDDELPEHAREQAHRNVDEHLAVLLERMPSLRRRLHVNEGGQLLFFPVDNSRTSEGGQESISSLRDALNGLALEVAEELGCIPTNWAHLLHTLMSGEDLGVGTSALEPGQQRRHVSFEDCICLGESLMMTPDCVRACLALFHGLGQVLHFPGSPAVVLDPQWLLDAMAHVVACPRVLQRHWHKTRALRDRGVLSEELLEVLWKEPQLHSHRSILRSFLEHFDLLVPSPHASDGEVHWLVPSLLPARRSAGCVRSRSRSASASLASPEADGSALLGDAGLVGSGVDAVVYIDFFGTLQKLLPSLLPRLLGHLRAREVLPLRVFEVWRDYACFSLGAPPAVVTIDSLPSHAPQVMRISIRKLPTIGAGTALKDVLDNISAALVAWMPRLAFSTKIECPVCCGCLRDGATAAAGYEPGAHLLDLEELQYCTRKHVELKEHYPAWVRAWRWGEHPPVASSVAAPVASVSSAATQLGDGELRVVGREGFPAVQQGGVDLHYLYGSPIVWRGHSFGEIDAMAELNSLQSLPGVCAQVNVATAQTLREALVANPAPPVLHISAHCVIRPQPLLFLEDEHGEGHAVSEEDLASMGPWNREGMILVFLACGSELLVRALIKRCGLRCAICCTEEVFDSAARLFSRTLYHALGAGHAVDLCFQQAKDAVRSSASRGLQAEAEKFLMLGRDVEDVGQLPEALAKPAVASAAGAPPTRVRWPCWPKVEDYESRVMETCQVAHCFKDRRVLVVWGADGVGKSAFCREFCRHYSSPGRLFSAGAYWLDYASLEMRDQVEVQWTSTMTMGSTMVQAGSSSRAELLRRALVRRLLEELPGAEVPPAPSATGPLVAALRTAAQRMDERGKWLVVIDGVPLSEYGAGSEDGDIAWALEALLDCCARLCVILTARRRPPQGTCWAAIACTRVNAMKLDPLTPPSAARLFLRRVRRPLYPKDFDLNAPGHGEEGATPLQYSREFVERVAASPLMHALGNLPRLIVEGAVEVDESLPSLLRHPALPATWRGEGGTVGPL